MYYQRNLRVQLQERRNHLYKAVTSTYDREVKYLLSFINGTPYLRGLVQELQALHPEITWELWKENKLTGREFPLPDTEAGAAKVAYGMLEECAQKEAAAQRYAFLAGGSGKISDQLRDLTERVVDYFFRYVHDRLDEGNSVLYLLEKYKHRVEWFHRKELLEQLASDTHHSEGIVDSDLREYLYDQGIDYPFSTPASPSGRTDIVADLGEERPVVLEIKLFDPERSYDRSYIRKGFRQIYDYATDYSQSAGYLVIFNCSPRTIVFNTKSASRQWPSRIEIDHKTFFLITIDLAVLEVSASKRGTLEPYDIGEDYLIESLKDIA